MAAPAKNAKVTSQTGLNEMCNGDDREWWCPRYRNCGSMEDFLGDAQPDWLEVNAVRTAQWLNGCRTLDWTYENGITWFLRAVGPGVRLGYFLTAFTVVVIGSLVLDAPPALMYPLRRDTLETRWSDLTMTITLLLWTFDFATLCWSYYDIRHNATPSDFNNNGEWVPFLRVPTLRSREQRAQDPETTYSTIVRGLAAAFYTVYFFIGVIATHTLLSHMYVNKNPFLAVLLIMQCIYAVFASLDDLTHIGSPWGIQECSKGASVLLSLRGLYVIPITFGWTGCAIAASFPPYYCREC